MDISPARITRADAKTWDWYKQMNITYTHMHMVLSFLCRSARGFISWPFPKPQAQPFTPAHMSLPGLRRKQQAPSLAAFATDVWNDASVQYHLIVLGLKYEISLQICPGETGMLCERRRWRTKLMWIRHTLTGREKKKKPTLVSGDNDCLVCFCGSAWPFQEKREGVAIDVSKTIYPPSSPNIPCNLISIPVPCLKLWDKLSGMTLVK